MSKEIVITEVYRNQFGLKLRKRDNGIQIITTSPDGDETNMIIYNEEIDSLIKNLKTLRDI